ncbi:MAG: membrane integrity-associated transporter subunit PqiC [Deltaproteobacteria bacterium]|jgi:uncharacterized lipoprotein YmbA|nr:membrane integrity-associated transporter subunit PqiC [Deltaproteobacteria bacterium]
MRRLIMRSTTILLAVSMPIIVGCLGLGGGTRTPTKFYVLHSMQSSEDEIQPIAKLPDTSIGVGPIRLPQYLDRPQIVRRSSQNQLELAEFAQWAEPIRVNFSRVLAENLGILLDTKKISLFPWLKTTQIDYQIILEITRFDGGQGNNALLRASWSIFGIDSKNMLVHHYSSYSEPAEANDTEALVAAQGQTVKHLSREIAQALQALVNGESSSQ